MRLDEITRIEDDVDRTAALVRFVQGCFGGEEDVPVLVGGGAVELYTGGAYTTGDLDFVGRVTDGAAARLEAAGFRREGRHWIHEGARVFVEFPSADLEPGEESAWMSLRKRRIRIVSLVDLIVDRLAAWQHWRSPVDGANAWLLWRARRSRVDRRRLARRAEAAGVAGALESLLHFDRRWTHKRPSDEEVVRWAREGP